MATLIFSKIHDQLIKRAKTFGFKRNEYAPNTPFLRRTVQRKNGGLGGNKNRGLNSGLSFSH